VSVFLARDAFVSTNRRAIAMMFVRLSICLSVCLSAYACNHKEIPQARASNEIGQGTNRTIAIFSIYMVYIQNSWKCDFIYY